MSFRLVRFTDPIALTGLLVSIGLAVALDVTGAASGPESLLAGLGAATLSLVLDATARAERRFELRRALDTSPWLPGLLRRTADATAEIVTRYPDGVVEDEARRRIERLAEELEDMSRGRFTRDGEDYEHLLTTLTTCRRTVDGVTNIGTDPDWWHTDLGRHYWQLNKEALERGVRIRRLFVYRTLTPALAELIAEQHAAGVQTAAVQRDALDPATHVNFVVWDGATAWRGQMSAQSEIIYNEFLANRHDVDRLITAFERCWALAAHHRPPPA